MKRNEFWGAVEKGIENSSFYDSEGNRNALFDIAIATSAVKDSLDYLPTLLAQIDDPRIFMNYVFHRGYLFSLDYYKNNENSLKENIPRIQNLIEIGLALPKMEKCYEKGIKKDFYAEQMKKGLEMLLMESKALLKEEIIRWNLIEYLVNVQDKKGYLENVLGIKDKKRPDDLAKFLLDFLQSSF